MSFVSMEIVALIMNLLPGGHWIDLVKNVKCSENMFNAKEKGRLDHNELCSLRRTKDRDGISDL